MKNNTKLAKNTKLQMILGFWPRLQEGTTHPSRGSNDTCVKQQQGQLTNSRAIGPASSTMQVQIRRKIREIILRGFAETMKQGEKHSFVSGENKITVKCLKEGFFHVTYEPRDQQDHTIVRCFTWNARENKWDKL